MKVPFLTNAATKQLIMNRMIGCILNNRVIYKKKMGKILPSPGFNSELINYG